MKSFKQRDISVNVSDEQYHIQSVLVFISHVILVSFSYYYQLFCVSCVICHTFMSCVTPPHLHTLMSCVTPPHLHTLMSCVTPPHLHTLMSCVTPPHLHTLMSCVTPPHLHTLMSCVTPPHLHTLMSCITPPHLHTLMSCVTPPHLHTLMSYVTPPHLHTLMSYVTPPHLHMLMSCVTPPHLHTLMSCVTPPHLHLFLPCAKQKKKMESLSETVKSAFGTIDDEIGGATLKFESPLDDITTVDLRLLRRVVLRSLELLHYATKWERLVDIAYRFTAVTGLVHLKVTRPTGSQRSQG